MRLADSRRMQVTAMSVMALLLVWSARPERARTWLEDRLADWRDRDEQVRAELVWYLAVVHVWSGQWSIASEFADQALEISIGYDVELPQHHLPPALIALHRGDLAAAREHSTKALALARGQLLPAHTAILGICAAWSGDPMAAVARLAQAEEAADGRGWQEPNLRCGAPNTSKRCSKSVASRTRSAWWLAGRSLRSVLVVSGCSPRWCAAAG